MESAIALHEVSKAFGEHRAVAGLSLEVPRGSVFGLLGRNGAGKTTTIRMIMDILKPDSGRVQVLGRDGAQQVRERVGYLPEERGLYPKMKVLDVVEFLGSIKGLPRAESRRRAERWLERLELGAWKHKKAQELSKGMQQKVQVAAAMVAEPELLILDEPFSGMDPVNQEMFKDLILELNRSGRTIVFSTHVMDSAEKLCQRIALIDRGRTVLYGPLDEIKQRFGKNSIRIEFDGDGEFLSRLPGVESAHDFGRHVELQLVDGADAQLLLREAMGRLRIHRFERVNPTLHHIFVREVGGGAGDA
jgi:ABC-2 type transport system ATP-binding protein